MSDLPGSVSRELLSSFRVGYPERWGFYAASGIAGYDAEVYL